MFFNLWAGQHCSRNVYNQVQLCWVSPRSGADGLRTMVLLSWDSVPCPDPALPASSWCCGGDSLWGAPHRAVTSTLLPEGSTVLIVNCLQITQVSRWLTHQACTEGTSRGFNSSSITMISKVMLDLGEWRMWEHQGFLQTRLWGKMSLGN